MTPYDYLLLVFAIVAVVAIERERIHDKDDKRFERVRNNYGRFAQ